MLVTLLFTDVRTLHAPAITGYPCKISGVRSAAKWTGQRVDCKSEIPFLKRPGPLSNAENHGIRGCKEKPEKFSLSSQKGPFFPPAFLKETDPVNDDNNSHSLNAHIKVQLCDSHLLSSPWCVPTT